MTVVQLSPIVLEVIGSPPFTHAVSLGSLPDESMTDATNSAATRH